MELRIAPRAKTVDKGRRADPRIETRSQRGAAQGLRHDARENTPRQRLDRGIVWQGAIQTDVTRASRGELVIGSPIFVPSAVGSIEAKSQPVLGVGGQAPGRLRRCGRT